MAPHPRPSASSSLPPDQIQRHRNAALAALTIQRSTMPTERDIEAFMDLLDEEEGLEDTTNPRYWLELFHHLIGDCTFSRLPGEQVNDSALGEAGPSTIRVRTGIVCTNAHHRSRGLSCTDPLYVHVNVDLLDVLASLETSHATRVAQLIAVVARSYRHHRPRSGPSRYRAPRRMPKRKGQGQEQAEGQRLRGEGEGVGDARR
ncbi:hypothetical protein NMY22_g18975 [Coprinellus aureogranulatus]|nr:hypothetical protein NMY22_g18975 [Coprinellus aureogranulatus]